MTVQTPLDPLQSVAAHELSDRLRQALITLPDLEAQAFFLQHSRLNNLKSQHNYKFTPAMLGY
jgi:hypothetical protein